MKRFLIYSGMMVLAIMAPSLVSADDAVSHKFEAPAAPQITIDTSDALTYFASGQHLKNKQAPVDETSAMAQKLGSIEPAAGTTPETAELREGVELYVDQGKIVTINKAGEVQNLNDQLPQNRPAKAEPSMESVKQQKLTDVQTGARTNIIMNTDTGVDMGR